MAVISWSDTKAWHSSSTIFEEIMNRIHTDHMSVNPRDALLPFRDYYYLDPIKLNKSEMDELLFLLKNINLTKSTDVFAKKVNELIYLINDQ